MNKPCNGCRHANHYTYGRKEHWSQQPFNSICSECEQMKKYQDSLERRRKYYPGSIIYTFDGLEKSFEDTGFVYFHGKILHRGFIESLQYRVLKSSLAHGCVRTAVRKE